MKKMTDQELALSILRRSALPEGVEAKSKYHHSASAEYETSMGLVSVDVECNQPNQCFVSITVTKTVKHPSEAVAFIDAKIGREPAVRS
jgi:hypothetical protein